MQTTEYNLENWTKVTSNSHMDVYVSERNVYIDFHPQNYSYSSGGYKPIGSLSVGEEYAPKQYLFSPTSKAEISFSIGSDMAFRSYNSSSSTITSNPFCSFYYPRKSALP